MTNPLSTTVVAAVRWLRDHGDLVGFQCREEIVPALFAEMRAKKLIQRLPRSTKYALTPAGEAFLSVHEVAR